MNTNRKRPLVASFFSGAGGMDEGFKAAGFRIHSCMDIESWACDTLRENNPNSIIIGPPEHSGNIKTIPPEEFSEIANVNPGDIDIFTGGPPCQPFSQAASQRFLKGDDRFKRKGFDDTEKGNLLFDYIRYVVFFRPTVFLLENVPGLSTIDGGVQLSHALSMLREAGYTHTEPFPVEAVEYGIPQYRTRLIIWGTLKPDITPLIPEPTHGGGLFLKPLNVVANALQMIDEDCSNHQPRLHKEGSVKRYKTLEFGQREHLGRVDRLDPYKPSKTVIAGGMNGGGRSHLHPFIARTLTVRECARLQTFSDKFVIKGNMSRQFTQIGNAVPPLLAEHFARQIGSQIYSMRFPDEFVCENYLQNKSDLEILVEDLLQWSVNSKPEWIYNTHSKRIAS